MSLIFLVHVTYKIYLLSVKVKFLYNKVKEIKYLFLFLQHSDLNVLKYLTNSYVTENLIKYIFKWTSSKHLLKILI